MILKTEVQLRNPSFSPEGEGQGTEPRALPALDPITSGDGITVKQAWEKINENSQQILFILDEGRRIIGAVADGDVRRWVLAGKGLGAPVTAIMNRNPVMVSELENPDSIRRRMLSLRIHAIPVVDSAGRLLRVLTWDRLMDAGKRVEKSSSASGVPTVILAGGLGTRLYPYTKILPKPLIPFGEKPIIEVIMDRFHYYGVRNFHVSVNHMANMIRAYFGDQQAAYKVGFVQEDKPLGTAGSLHLLKGAIKKDFFVTNCDILIDADYGSIMDFHKAGKNDITMVCCMKRSSIPYGIVEITKGGTLRTLKEKPEFDHLVNTGMYVVRPGMLDLVPKNKFFHFTDLIEKAKAKGFKVGIYPISENAWLDIGQIEEYRSALARVGQGAP
jgi:dTDP-glucose pyrophosphorylase